MNNKKKYDALDYFAIGCYIFIALGILGLIAMYLIFKIKYKL